MIIIFEKKRYIWIRIFLKRSFVNVRCFKKLKIVVVLLLYCIKYIWCIFEIVFIFKFILIEKVIIFIIKKFFFWNIKLIMIKFMKLYIKCILCVIGIIWLNILWKNIYIFSINLLKIFCGYFFLVLNEILIVLKCIKWKI